MIYEVWQKLWPTSKGSRKIPQGWPLTPWNYAVYGGNPRCSISSGSKVRVVRWRSLERDGGRSFAMPLIWWNLYSCVSFINSLNKFLSILQKNIYWQNTVWYAHLLSIKLVLHRNLMIFRKYSFGDPRPKILFLHYWHIIFFYQNVKFFSCRRISLL